jgi:hypothetical protein
VQNEWLDNLVGKWRISRVFTGRTFDVTWQIERKDDRLVKRDVTSSAEAEADFIERLRDPDRYVLAWVDDYSDAIPTEVRANGVRRGDSIVFEWDDPDGAMRNTFAWHAEDGTWTATIEQLRPDGTWKPCGVDTFRRVN